MEGFFERAGHVTRIEHEKFWLENLKGIDHTEDVGVDGRIILEWILHRQDGK
jgi:hypothetical protein